ncbi:PAS domain-containing protein [Azoarcus sp. TTM-91]|uniref:PAS domain-containing protein n=1 Tax=Azoarcus sp. TTM-91 TaxID=2691581 RepID=UPI00145DB48B
MVSYLPLRQLLLGIVLVFGVLVAAGQFAFILNSYSEDARTRVEMIARHSGGTLAANLEAALAEGDGRYARQLVAQRVTLPHLVYAAFVGSGERIVAATRPGLEGRMLEEVGLPAPPSALVSAARRTLAGQVAGDRGSDRLWGVFPVRLPAPAGQIRSTQAGYAVILLDTGPLLRSARQQALRQSLIVLLPILLLSLGIGALVKVLLTDRIEQLLAYTRSQARGGNLPRPVSGSDELGLLGRQLSSLMREVLDSRDYHVRLLDRMPNPIWRADAAGAFDYFNQAWLSSTGRELAQELGEGWLAGVHPDDLASWQRIFRAALSARRPFSTEYRLRFRNGGYHWMASHAEPILGADGRFLGYIGSCFDMQQDRDAAAAIAASEARFRGLVERTLVGVYLVRDGRMTYANPRLAEWFGYEVEEIIDLPIARLVHPDDLPRVTEQLRRRTTGEVDFVQYEFRGIRRDGSAFPVEVYGSRIDYEGGPAVIGALLDLTNRYRDQAALKAASAVVEASPTVLFRWRLSPGWPVTYVSENIHRWGYSTAQLTAADFRFIELVHPEDRERVEQAEAEGDNAMREYRIRSGSGEYIWVEERGSLQRDADGRPVERTGLLTDVTERHRKDAAIRELNAELEARVEQRTAQLAVLNKELETFAYSVSHDLKAPLRGIDGYSHLLMEDYAGQLDEEGKLFIRHIRSGVKQMARLIDDLLAYSRMERRTLQRTEVNLPDMVRGILAERAAELESGHTRIEVDVPELRVQVDPDGLAQVLRNLVDNALKYSRDAVSPEIRISARAEGERCHVRVQDNGIGFDMKFHDRIFEIFQRLQRAEDYAGTGVGLAIVRKAVQRMGGRVWAEGAVGQGATFHLELPL